MFGMTKIKAQPCRFGSGQVDFLAYFESDFFRIDFGSIFNVRNL
jgi:hypothetical protein